MRRIKKPRPVCGVGINDSDDPVYATEVVDGRKKILWVCPFYTAWKSMLFRCYSPKYQDKHPSYIGCSVAPQWLRFSVFREWISDKELDGNQLDKDLLIPGNKVYGPDTCVVVSGQLNTFMLDNNSSRGEYPIGVCWHKSAGKIMALCSNPFTGRQEFLGYFTCPDKASEAWRRRKHELACQYADLQTDPRIAEALRIRYAAPIAASSTKHQQDNLE